MTLTKSDYLISLDSPLHLWAKHHNQLDEKEPNLYDQHLARQGYEVQELAQEFLRQKVAREYADADISFEVTLIDGNYEVRVDALVHDKLADTYDIYEIKSSTRIHRDHEFDVTFQYLVAQAQRQVHAVYIVCLQKQYVRGENLDINQLFRIEDMMDSIALHQSEVAVGRELAWQVLQLSETPLEQHCLHPSKCPCVSLCHPNLPEYPIYDLTRGSKDQYLVANQLGIKSLFDIPDTFPLTFQQKLQVEATKSGKPIIQKDLLRGELEKLKYPLYFLDYETLSLAIPRYQGYVPYQNITFQYSLHTVRDENSEATHSDFLALNPAEPSRELVEHLVSDIGETGSVIVWNKGFECTRNAELARLHPEFAERLLDINNRTYDLMDVFRNGYYVDHRFHGSASIKKVLPILVSSLSYKDLTIGEGTAAMIAWWQLVFGDISEQEKEEIAENLLTYCKLDTLAMVEVWQFLRRQL